MNAEHPRGWPYDRTHWPTVDRAYCEDVLKTRTPESSYLAADLIAVSESWLALDAEITRLRQMMSELAAKFVDTGDA